MKDAINKFFKAETYAVIGVSSNPRKFGNVVYRSLKEHGLTVYPVNPRLTEVDGDTCYPSVLELPYTVHAVVTVVPPEVTTAVVADCARTNIRAIWMQQGSESKAAIEKAEYHGIEVIHGQCILMFMEPVKSFHRVHRWVNKMVGAYPN